MNTNNLLRNQLHRAQVLPTTDHIAIATVTKRALGFANPPTWETDDRFTNESAAKLEPAAREFTECDSVNLPAARAILALTGLDNITHEVTNNPHLSPAGRTEALKEPRSSMIKAITAAAVDVAAQGRERNAGKDAFYGPAPLPPNDVNEALVDRELRDRHFAQPLAKRMQSIAQWANSQDDRALAALMRSPTSLEANEAALVRDAWHTHVDRRQPAKAAELKTALAIQSWAETIIHQAAQYASRLSGLTPAEIADAAGADGRHLFSNDTSNTAVHGAA